MPTSRDLIVVVDDNATKRFASAETLKSGGYDVREAATGKDGLWLVQSCSPQLVLLDIKLPDISGFEVARILKDDAATAAIPILHLSAHHTSSADLTVGLQRADGYLTGAVEPTVLLATIRALLRTSRSERAAKAMASQWNMTFDALRDGVCLVGPDGAIVRANRALADLIGTAPEALVGTQIEVGLRSAFGAAVALPEPLVPLSERRDQDQELQVGRRMLRLSSDPVVDASGQVISSVYIIADVTWRKLLERERDDLMQLEKIGRVHAAASQQEAERAHRVRDEFLANLTHELRSPLNVIVGNSEMLMAGLGSADDKKRFLAAIHRGGNLELQLVDDLLDMSRIILGKLTLDVVPFDLAEVASSATAAIEHAARAKEITVNRTFAPDTGQMSGDSKRIQQVIWNLLANAVKFTPRAGRIDLGIGRRGGNLEITVKDTGVGIETDFLPLVFERFRQEDASAARQFGGLGIGLSIVRHIVEGHGGTVSVTSEGRGTGATFKVTLPCSTATAGFPRSS